MRPVSPCTTQYLKRSVKRYSVWIVAEVDAGVGNDVLRQIKMLESSRDGLKTIHTHGTLNIVVWVSNPTYPFGFAHRANNQCVVCGMFNGKNRELAPLRDR